MKNSLFLKIIVSLLVIFLSACGQVVLPTPAKLTQSSALPDLTISNAHIAMQGVPDSAPNCVSAYAPYELRALVENQGSALAMNIPVTELSTGYAIQIGELPPGQSMEIFLPTSSSDGRYQISVDLQNQIPETDENNNIASYLAITPTPPALCPSTAPTAGPGWSLYHNDQYNFTFEYPAAYDAPANQAACGLKLTDTGLRLGQRIDLQFLDTGGLGLEGYVSNLVQTQGWSIDSQKNETIGGSNALTIQYRFGGTNRFGSVSLVEHGGHILGFNFTAGSFCEIPGVAAEPEVYAHLLQTFRFNP